VQVQLGGPDWAEIAEPSELRNGDRKAVNKTIRLQMDEDGSRTIGGDYEDLMRDALLKRIVRNWSLPFPVPKDDPESLDKLTLEQADVLAKAVQPHLDLINGKVDPTKKDSDPTADSGS